MHGRSRRTIILASLQYWDGARRVFTDQADIASTMASAKRREVFGESVFPVSIITGQSKVGLTCLHTPGGPDGKKQEHNMKDRHEPIDQSHREYEI